MRGLQIAGLSCGLALACLAHIQTAAEAASVERGRTFVEENCSGCHAIGRDDESPLNGAPPLRNLHKIYPVEDLFEAFAEGIVTGHPDMPDFTLEPAEIEDLIAYLKTLEG